MAVESSSLSPISADCFAPSQGLLPLEEAWRRIAVSVSPVCAAEDCAVPQAAGRILAESVVAPLPMPPHDNAAMDGYAVSGADLAAALSPLDRKPIRAASHILISVAGAIGATRLQHCARMLNTSAHEEKEATLPAEVRRCMDEIDAAVAFADGQRRAA